ncbi:MAG TPA: acyl-CoA synthetase FdrA [candidate division Zixibacteria bacterium]|nr:acyl-CoA synthetase FdrA [candidate division Zixibacteria bacterium]
MSTTINEIRPGAYFDSVVLMQLQRELAQLPGVLDAGVVMATPANCELLTSSGFTFDTDARSDDLLIVVEAESEQIAHDALAQVDELMSRKRHTQSEGFLPKSLQSAAGQLPDSSWVLVSVPGRYAAKVARDGLDINRNVFLYSDNVPLKDEIELKQYATDKDLLMMGPDCGTAIIHGVGFGFANHVRQGSIGLVGASGTGLQVITAEIHRLGAGISHAIGTGGRDLDIEVGALTALKGLNLLAGDDDTNVIVLVSKPPDPEVASRLLLAAWRCGKPVVINLIGHPPPARRLGPLHFASSLSDAASLAALLTQEGVVKGVNPSISHVPQGRKPGYVRGLMAGGTIAYEVAIGLQSVLGSLYSNLHIDGGRDLPDIWSSQGHAVLDLGDDTFTQGRLHPMMDNDYRIRRIKQETADEEVGVILFDLVLGEGAHPDPASELAPVIAEIQQEASQMNRVLEFVCIVIGTEDDPQDLAHQIEQMTEVGAAVFQDIGEAIAAAISITYPFQSKPSSQGKSDILSKPISAINVGLRSFSESLRSQGAEAIDVDWRPPASGDDRLASLLSKMK